MVFNIETTHLNYSLEIDHNKLIKQVPGTDGWDRIKIQDCPTSKNEENAAGTDTEKQKTVKNCSMKEIYTFFALSMLCKTMRQVPYQVWNGYLKIVFMTRL